MFYMKNGNWGGAPPQFPKPFCMHGNFPSLYRITQASYVHMQDYIGFLCSQAFTHVHKRSHMFTHVHSVHICSYAFTHVHTRSHMSTRVHICSQCSHMFTVFTSMKKKMRIDELYKNDIYVAKVNIDGKASKIEKSKIEIGHVIY